LRQNPTLMSAPTDTTRCPLCGGPNGCAMAQGAAPETCWCMRTAIPESVLSRLPEAERGLRCICARCAAADPHPASDPDPAPGA